MQGFGSLSISCSDTEASGISGEINVGNEPSLRVTALERPLSPLRKWRVGAQMDRRYNQDWLFTIVSPIRVRFRAGRYDGRFCAHPQMWLADEWEVERMLWVHRANGQTSVNAFANSFPVRPGMNKLQVAHLLGFPSEFGTVRDMLKLDDWKYAEPAPFAYSVRFRNGVVAEVHPPGNLP